MLMSIIIKLIFSSLFPPYALTLPPRMISSRKASISRYSCAFSGWMAVSTTAAARLINERVITCGANSGSRLRKQDVSTSGQISCKIGQSGFAPKSFWASRPGLIRKNRIKRARTGSSSFCWSKNWSKQASCRAKISPFTSRKTA